MEPGNWYVYFKSSPETLTSRRACQRAPCLHKEGAPKPHGHSPSVTLPKLAINPSSRPPGRLTWPCVRPQPRGWAAFRSAPNSGLPPRLHPAGPKESAEGKTKGNYRVRTRKYRRPSRAAAGSPRAPPRAVGEAGRGPAEAGRPRGANLQARRVGARGLGERLAARTPELPPRLPGDEDSALPQFLRAAAERGLRDLRALGGRAAAGPGRELPGGGRRGTGLRSERLHGPGARLPPVAAGSGPARAGEGRLLTCADRPRSAPES